MKYRFLQACFLLLACSALPALASDEARARLDRFATDVHSLSSDFVQVVTDANGHAQPEVVGHLALKQPRLFRWETTTPTQQLIVADGSRVWVYDPELEQVTVRRQSVEEAHSPLTVLTDMSQLEEQFKLSEAGQRDGLAWLRLSPLDETDAQFDYAELGFDDEGLRRMLFRDQLGSTSVIVFSDWQRNPTLPASTFTFSPPAGVDVIGDLPVAEVHALDH